MVIITTQIKIFWLRYVYNIRKYNIQNIENFYEILGIGLFKYYFEYQLI